MRLTCPAVSCRADNDARADACARCGTPLSAYARLSVYPARLFNQGLAAARGGQLLRARDLFAAVVCWCPLDMEARNALAMACYALGDKTEALIHWRTVLARLPEDAIARQGVAAIESATIERAGQSEEQAHHVKARHKKKTKRRR
jgi:Flp pilus assembly protein TadD